MKITYKELLLVLVLITGISAFSIKHTGNDIVRQLHSVPPLESERPRRRTVVQVLGCMARACLTSPKHLVWQCARDHCQNRRHTTTAAAVSPPETARKTSDTYENIVLNLNAIREDVVVRAHAQSPRKVAKRWQFSDPLQVCIHQECKGEMGATFYTCVYSKCIKAGAGKQT